MVLREQRGLLLLVEPLGNFSFSSGNKSHNWEKKGKQIGYKCQHDVNDFTIARVRVMVICIRRNILLKLKKSKQNLSFTKNCFYEKEYSSSHIFHDNNIE